MKRPVIASLMIVKDALGSLRNLVRFIVFLMMVILSSLKDLVLRLEVSV